MRCFGQAIQAPTSQFVLKFAFKNHKILLLESMEATSNIKKNQKPNPLTLAVLNLPTKSSLLELPSPGSEYNLVHHSRKKINLAVYKIQIPRSKLFTNL